MEVDFEKALLIMKTKEHKLKMDNIKERHAKRMEQDAALHALKMAKYSEKPQFEQHDYFHQM